MKKTSTAASNNGVAHSPQLSEQEREEIAAKMKGERSTHTCPSCGKPAQCDISQGKSTCWCFNMDRRDTSDVSSNGSCLCSQCLAKLPPA